ncbi:helix-turn-helix domain-containing protein [Paenibacillus sp. YN15]|uniref:helix-turn-helix domain-containing protein n=1 Tax=Paenibacillus sp. YN15 TaxID=1742774 RepID=UPI0015ECCC51|nr:helix-turn-helix domain-containing protein [Paenibacillus sp. YN15]
METKRRKWFNGRSVLLTWSLSYLAVLLLPVVLSAIVYVQSSKMLTDEIHLANNSLLKQLRELMDKQIEAVDRLNFELSWNTKVRELVDQHKYTTYPEEYLYDLHNATKDLVLYQSAYSEADLFYIYLAQRDAVMLPGVYRDTQFAYNEHHQSSDLSYEEWIAILRRDKFKGFVPMKRVLDRGGSVPTLAYINTYDYEEGKPSGANVIMIDQSKILTAINNIQDFSKGLVLITDADNKVLVSSSESGLLSQLPFGRLPEGGGMFFWESEGHKYEVFNIPSAVSKLQYISIIPSEVYWKKAQLVRNLTFMSIAASLIGGGILTFIFLRLNYNPVQRLVRAFRNKSVGEKSGNEFLFIQQAVDSTLSEMDHMMLEMKKQHHTLRSNFVTRLLKGKQDNGLPLEESLAAFEMELLSDRFAVLLCYIEDHDVFLERIQGKSMAEKLKLLYFIVTNVVEELIHVRHRGYVTEVDDELACLVSLSATAPEEQMQDMLQAARTAQEFLADKYSIYITVSLSRIYSGLDQVHQAYQEALYAMEYKLVMGKQEILPYEEIERYTTRAETDSGYYYPLQHEQQLMNHVKVGDFAAAKGALEEILEMNFAGHSVSVPVARCLMLDLVGTLIKSIGELGAAQDNILIQNPRRIERLSASETLTEMREHLTEMLQEACDYAEAKRMQNVQLNRQRALDGLIGEVSAYIDEHYADPGLNVSVLGQLFEMKPTYLSKLYKDQTGEGLLEAVNRKRIAYAKQLMSAGKLTVNEAAEKSGFNDVGTFIRTFKKIEGITPGKYKEIHEE